MPQGGPATGYPGRCTLDPDPVVGAIRLVGAALGAGSRGRLRLVGRRPVLGGRRGTVRHPGGRRGVRCRPVRSGAGRLGVSLAGYAGAVDMDLTDTAFDPEAARFLAAMTGRPAPLPAEPWAGWPVAREVATIDD